MLKVEAGTVPQDDATECSDSAKHPYQHEMAD